MNNPAAREVKAYQASLSFQQLTFCAFQGSRAPKEDTSNASKRSRAV